jgi:5-(carboxyamino)imidazole ribonucleotide synthase
VILPGATLGMLGGGQLGRMFTIAARTMGYHVIVLDPDSDSPAGRMADEHLHAAYQDDWALEQLGKSCDVITTEFENIPADTLRKLAEYCPVRPSAMALELTQNRIREKTFIRETGLQTAPFFAIYDVAEIEEAFNSLSEKAILKRAAFGYDGKGQYVVATVAEAEQAFLAMDSEPCVLEDRIDLALEVSVVVARSAEGDVQCYPVAENIHVNGILDQSIVPARISSVQADQAREMAMNLADALDYYGVMAVEFFVTRSGDLLVNEIAPRPHNSGHYTLDACVTSQFEQQVRMVCGLPFGDTGLLSPVVMVNLLGDIWGDSSPHWEGLLEHPSAKLHLYGKREARPGRKMGHYCVLAENQESAITQAESIMKVLRA